MHLATRNVFFGAGYLDRRGVFQVSQKAVGLGADFENKTLATNNTKPVVNLRDEPHANREQWVRVHVTSGDPNMSPWATFMKLATTSLVLRLIENDHDLPWLRFGEQLFEATRLVSGDTKFEERLTLVDGRTIRPVDVQGILALEAQQLSEKIELPEEEARAIKEWLRASNDAGKDPLLLYDRADWVAKYLALKHYKKKRDITWNDKDMQTKDRQWDLLGSTGVGWAIREGTWSNWMPDGDLIEERMQYPPEDTRAFVRGTFVRTFANTPKASTDWAHATVDQKTFNLYQPDGSDAERLWNRIIDETKSSVKLSA